MEKNDNQQKENRINLQASLQAYLLRLILVQICQS